MSDHRRSEWPEHAEGKLVNAIRPTTKVQPRVRRAYAILIGLSVLFIFLQSITAGEFITDGLAHGAKETWTDVHGFIAYPVMVFTLAATVVAFVYLNRPRSLPILTGVLFVASVVQWRLGLAISTLGMDWVTPVHVAVAFVIYGLAIVLSVRTTQLRKLAAD